MTKKTPKPLSATDKKWIGIFAIILAPLFLYISYKTLTTAKSGVSTGHLCMFAGLLTAYSRIVKWDKVLYTILGAFAVSLIIFISALGDTPLQDLYQGWSVIFFIGILFLAVVFGIQDVLPKINEGTVLLQTIALAYWILCQKEIEVNWFTICFSIAGLFFTIYTLYHAFSLDAHTTTTKLTLSIWSCIIVLVLGFDNATQVFKLANIDSQTDAMTAAIMAAQFFMTGISIFYLYGNLILVYGLIESAGNNSNKEHLKEQRELKKIHENRMSDQQTRGYHVITLMVFTGVVFGVNYHYQFLPANFLIWCVFIVFPILMYFFQKLFPPIGYTKTGDRLETDFFENYKRFK